MRGQQRRANVLADPHSVQQHTGCVGHDLIWVVSVCEIRTMALRSLQTFMENSFHPSAAMAIDATFRVAIDDESLIFDVRHGKLEFVDSGYFDATFYFPDADTAQALLSGRADVSEAFMNGRFRADGYLMWAFALLAMFHDPSLPH